MDQQEKTTLVGRWGGEWECYGSSSKRAGGSSLPKTFHLVKSKRTGYVTEMREDSFV